MIKRTLRNAYRQLFPEHVRKWLFKLRNPGHFRRMRTAVNPSPKGDFSLRSFDKHRCIFVHITKSAGTSVAKALFGELPYHHTAMDYRIIYGRKTFEDYFKFAFVRNPWDRLYSAFSYLSGGGWNTADADWAQSNLAGYANFREFVMRGLDDDITGKHIHFRKQLDFLTDPRGRLLIDHIAYFETIADDFVDICRRTGIKATLGHTNKSSREDYRQVYDARMIDRVAEIYAADIEAFGYTFEGIGKRRRVDSGRLIEL